MSTRSRSGTDIALVVLGLAVAFTGVLWAGGAFSASLFAHPPAWRRPFAGIAALAHPADPDLAWHVPVGPPVAYWACVGATSILAGGGIWEISRLVRSVMSPAATRRAWLYVEGLATPADIRTVAGAKALLARSATLRPSLVRPKPSEVGFHLGVSRGVTCWASVEDSMLLLGPPRSGKGTQVVIPMILDAPGPVVTTSTRPDNLATTIGTRHGPICVFDPQQLASPRQHDALRWSLLRGCADPRVAMVRAQALVPDAGSSGVENANFWRAQTLSVTRCLLQAAALDGRPPADLYRWSHAAGGAKEAVAILGTHPDATQGWERALDAVIAAEQRTRDSVWAMVANTFAPLADPAVLDAVTPTPEQTLEPAAFLQAGGTLYLLGTATGASATATLVAAFIEDMVDTARRLAALSPGQRLDPPLTLVLDEAANYPLPSLPSLMSDGGGSGICTLAVLQSLAQARDRWGREAATAIWDAAIVKLVLGGSANADDLGDLSRLIGERDVREWSETHQGGGLATSASSSIRRRPILEPADIRLLPIGTGLLLLRAAPPIALHLRPWTARRDAEALRTARTCFEQSATNDA